MHKKFHVSCKICAFTLIELLIVVAIIAILASIAIPNFLEAQTRSKIARIKSDMRTIGVALEAYFTDYNAYPPRLAVRSSRFRRLKVLSTPVAYISSVPSDIFHTVDPDAAGYRKYGNYAYGSLPIGMESRWALASDGPDLTNNRPNSTGDDTIVFYPGYDGNYASDPMWVGKIWENPDPNCPYLYFRYDPTNGTISKGDIWRVSDHTME